MTRKLADTLRYFSYLFVLAGFVLIAGSLKYNPVFFSTILLYMTAVWILSVFRKNKLAHIVFATYLILFGFICQFLMLNILDEMLFPYPPTDIPVMRLGSMHAGIILLFVLAYNIVSLITLIRWRIRFSRFDYAFIALQMLIWTGLLAGVI